MEEFKTAPVRKKSKLKTVLLPVTIVLIVMIVIASLLFWLLTGIQTYYMAWGPKDITFYSQLPISDHTDEFFESGHIDGGFNDSVYRGSYEYSKYKNEKLKIKSEIGVTNSFRWSMDNSAYIDDQFGINAQYLAGAKTVVSSGFNVAAAFEEIYTNEPGFTDQDFARNGWQSIVLDDSMLAMTHRSATSVFYNSADAGFLAGLAASIYTLDTAIHDFIADGTYNDDIVIWGGSSFNTVYEIMSGFEQGINYFNYKILGVDVNGTTYDESADTLGLINKLSVDISEEIADGLDMTNGFDLTPDYTTSFETNNTLYDVDTTPDAWMNEWYSGNFDSGIETDAGKMAISRTKEAMANGTSILFPVAGGQYLDVTTTLEGGYGDAHSDNTMLIGVDVDGTASDPEGAEYYLGSAIKNLVDSTSLAIWSSDDSINKSKEATFGGISTTDFMTPVTESELGWKVEELNGAKPSGNLYKGTYQNGGVGFVQGTDNGGTTALEMAYEDLISLLGITSAPNTFEEYADNAYLENIDKVGAIEVASNTFTSNSVQGTSDGTITDGASALWIPDWTVYYNTL